MKNFYAALFIIITISLIGISFSSDSDYYWDDIFENHGSVMLIINPETGEIISSNTAAEKFYGYTKEELKSMNINDINVLSDEEVKSEMDEAVKQNRNYFNFDHRLKDGSMRHVEVYSYPSKSPDGKDLLFSIIHDVTEKVQLENENRRNRTITILLLIIILITLVAFLISIEKSKLRLEKERNLLKTTLYSVGDGVISINKLKRINFMNKEAEKLTGWSNHDAVGNNFKDIFRLSDNSENKIFDLSINSENEKVTTETYLISKSGDMIPIDYNVSQIRSELGNLDGFVVAFRDYTDKNEKQSKILYLSYHDQLTGLYNRRYFEEKIREMNTPENLPLTIAMVDVNGLKLTNDAFGHSVGDKLLKNVATVLKLECRKGDFAARIGGDEFVIILPSTTAEAANDIVNDIYESIENETMENIIISVSIGCCTKIHPEEKIHEIFARAENHMYKKKLIESQNMKKKTIDSILRKLGEENPIEKLHSENVSKISKKIGELMGLDEDSLNDLETIGRLHDIGKISIDYDLFNLPRELNEEEYEEVKKHSESGYYILKTVDKYSNYADLILSHHERYDGKGYPRGKKGDEIPLFARIIAVADAYDSMSSERSYRPPLERYAIIKELSENASTQFDPDIVRVLIENIFEF